VLFLEVSKKRSAQWENIPPIGSDRVVSKIAASERCPCAQPHAIISAQTTSGTNALRITAVTSMNLGLEEVAFAAVF
jgi:hypothetical protein